MTFHRYVVSLLLATAACYAANSAATDYGRLPLAFERNQGQTDSATRFVARGRRSIIALTDDGVKLGLKEAPGNPVYLHFAEKARNSRFESPDKLPGVSNYLIGNDPRRWIQGIPQFGKVWERGVYPGIDVAYYGTQGQLEYDFVVAPGAHPERIQLQVTGAGGIRLSQTGSLLLDVNGHDLEQKPPVAWQERGGQRSAVAVQYRLLGGDRVALAIAAYDHSRPLVIDPVLMLVYSTYFGGSLADQANGIAVDAFGEAWIAGSTTSLDFPTSGPAHPVIAGLSDAFVAKLDPTGSTLLFSTYIGGTGNDSANSIAVDSTGNAYIAGSTNSGNFPTMAPLQASNGGGSDAFALKLSPNGSVVYSTYIGGAGDDFATGVAVDGNQNAYVSGYTSSAVFPTMSPMQPTLRGGNDAFVLKLNAAGSALVYSSYFGGAGDDQANGVAVDSQGNAYIGGSTQSSNFPTATPLQPGYGGKGNGFVAKFNSAGSIVYSTYLGGSGGDSINGIAVDSAGDAYVTGATFSRDFPTKNAVQPNAGDNSVTLTGALQSSDAFLAEINPAGTALIFSTYIGGATTAPYSAVNLYPGGNDAGYGVALDPSGNVYVTGSTSELGTLTPTPGVFPLQDALQGYIGPTSVTPQAWYHTDAFLASFTSSGALLYSTDLGGSYDDVAMGVAADSTSAYVTGYTRSGDFPLQSPEQRVNIAACPTANQGCLNSEAFISKFSFNTPGVRVFIGAVVTSNTSLTPMIPLTVTGFGCSPGSYTAGNPASATLGVPLIFQAGATCTLSVSNTAPSAGVRYSFATWADAPGGNPRLLTAPTHGFTYTANLAPQYQLTTTVSSGGTLTINPPSPDGFYANGATVQLAATPAAGYRFLGFTGDLFAATSPQAFMMTQPYNVTATFVPNSVPSVSIDAPINNASINGSIAVTGWALDNTSASGTAITRVQVLLDGAVMGNATYGLPRPDVCNLYPNRPNCPNVGFSFTLNANTLVPGTHLITVTATDSDGTPDSGSASVNVVSSIAMTGSKAAVFRNNISFLADSNGSGLYESASDRFIANFTAPGGFQTGDLPVVGDWTGDGHAKAGIYRPSTGMWWLDANNDGVFDSGDIMYQYGGLAGDLPVVGDWNGVAGVSTHKDCVGIYRSQGSFWLLDLNCNGAFENTPTDAFFPFGGLAGDVPVVGRWTGGLTRVGVVRKYAPGGVPVGNPFFWVPDAGAANAGNTPANHPADVSRCFAFGGLTGDVFITGDWNNTGTSMAGVYRNGFWVLDGALPNAPQASHIPGFSFGYGGVPGDIPVPGKW